MDRSATSGNALAKRPGEIWAATPVADIGVGFRSSIPWRWWLGSVLSISLLLSAYRYLDQVRAGRGWGPWAPLINETTAVVSAALLFFGVRALVHHRPLGGRAGYRQLPWYVVSLLTFSLLHTSIHWAARSLLYPVFGLGAYDCGPMHLAYAMELPVDVLLFASMVAVLLGLRQAARSRTQAFETARLSRALAESRLEALNRSLEPHFLFNALNTISSAMYRDVESADEMIQHLGDLLRAALSTRRTAEVTVREELDTLAPYLALLQARFEDRLELAIRIEPGVETATIPSLLLQPLVENAVRHGGAERLGRGRVEISISRGGERLRIAVVDDGPGIDPGIDPLTAGHGLRTTAERLRLLHGEQQTLEAANLPDGGFRVAIAFPCRPAPEETR